MLFWIIFFIILSTVVSISIAFLIVISRKLDHPVITEGLISFAIGVMLTTAFIGMIPKAISSGNTGIVTMVLLSGIILFYILERFLILKHCHNADCDQHTQSGTLILVGDGVHNFMDGVAIAAGFLVGFEQGLIISLSVAAHEAPQEISDFVILLKSGYSRKKALFFNILSGMTSVIGGILGFYFLSQVKTVIPYVIAFAASSFIYIAIGDLIPMTHHHTKIKLPYQILFMFSGISIMFIVLNLR